MTDYFEQPEHPTAEDFKNAKTVAEFDDLVETANQHFAFSFETEEEYEAAGGDGAANDALDAWLNNIGLEGTEDHRRHLEAKELDEEASREYTRTDPKNRRARRAGQAPAYFDESAKIMDAAQYDEILAAIREARGEIRNKQDDHFGFSAQRRIFMDGEIQWAASFNRYFDMVVFTDEDWTDKSNAEIASEIAACWNEDRDELQFKTSNGDFAITDRATLKDLVRED